MARFDFRQGVARRQEDGFGAPAHLQPSNGGSWIDLLVTPDPTIFTIAHFDINYLFTENSTLVKAWGPFTSGIDYWLYWDVDFITGAISRGYTTVAPTYSPQPPSTEIDKHWFDTTNKIMKVWTGSLWLEKLRVFAVKYQSGSTLVHYSVGTQVALSGSNFFAGPILFDPDGKPLQKFNRNRRGQFITTETDLHSQYSRIANFRVEAAVVPGEAQENIPIHRAVGYYDYNKLVLARNTVPNRPAIGLSSEQMGTGEVRPYITKGFISNDVDWDWSGYPAGTKLFVGAAGELVTSPPTTISAQQVATVVDKQTIYVSIHPLIKFDDPAANTVALNYDKDTGAIIAKGSTSSGSGNGCLPLSSSLNAKCTWGFSYAATVPTTTWNVSHNFGTDKIAAVQVFDLTGAEVFPDQITILDINNVQIEFTSPQDGTVNFVLLI